MKTVFIQNWEESERGWGVRPDGFTIHTSEQQLQEYVRWYNETFNNLAEAPDEYTRVSGKPVQVEVSDELYDRLLFASLRTVEGRIVKAVNGKGSYFDSRNKKTLTEEDVNFK